LGNLDKKALLAFASSNSLQYNAFSMKITIQAFAPSRDWRGKIKFYLLDRQWLAGQAERFYLTKTASCDILNYSTCTRYLKSLNSDSGIQKGLPADERIIRPQALFVLHLLKRGRERPRSGILLLLPRMRQNATAS
jgi:hypothetical protein